VGLATVLLGGYLLLTTGASVGAIVGAFGGQGALLLVPHGALEVASWTAAAAVGLLPLTNRLGGTPNPRPVLCRRTAAMAATSIVLVILAAAIETGWTQFYGPHLSC